ncbi:hypothetical protein EON82_01710 [bacterium]|nr:MAG: hypothetical protein EON82_01710 [bacterium]
MNDDLKAYVDGELPPDIAERMREALERDRDLALQAEQFRQIGDTLRSFPEPEPVGQAATLAALSAPRGSFGRTWGLALAGCAAVLIGATWVSKGGMRGRWIPIQMPPTQRVELPPVEVEIPAARGKAFEKFIQQRGGQVRKDGDGLRAFYDPSLQRELIQRFNLPEGTPWPAEGLRIRLTP